MKNIPMVDLHQQYLRIKEEIDPAIADCLNASQFIGGPFVKQFEDHLSGYLKIKEVISCANGTDALQVALMALDLPPGSKIIVPAFTYIAPVEVISLLGFIPVFADVDPDTYNIRIEEIEKVYTKDVRALIVVHLFGQPCSMAEIDAFCKKEKIFLVEDNAQSLGAEKNIGRNSIITTSFFPSKNLGGYGDGGALMTNDAAIAAKLRSISNHGQRERYYHDAVGINSRLDALQAAILNVKLKYLDEFISARKKAAAFYTEQLLNISQIIPPAVRNSGHTFHQYTIRVEERYRDPLQHFLKEKEISSAIYYPLPCYMQKAYLQEGSHLPATEQLCRSVLSLPVYPEITEDQLLYICETIKSFFNNA